MTIKSRYELLREERRYVRVPVDVDIFGNVLLPAKSTPDYFISVDGLPADALFIDACLTPQKQVVDFLYAHESFDRVPEGAEIPTRSVYFHRTVLREEAQRSAA
ncbi:hypothetical protein [Rhodococcus aetherivorans]|uniref:hypothetical protein n=1 Tax=Rhodococcus aetherivorans TaxID=191292 RepID=UPI00388FC9A4